MRTLPLYPTRPRAAVEYESPRTPTHHCRRCDLAQGAKAVCAKPDGRLWTAHGGVYVLGPALLKSENFPGVAPFAQGVLGSIRTRVSETLGEGTSVVYDWSVRCPAPDGVAPAAAVDACRGYLTEVLAKIRPGRILAFGDTAASSLFGAMPKTRSLRRGIAWLHVAGVVDPVPVYIFPDPVASLKAMTMRQEYLGDITWALGNTPLPPPWNGVYHVVETVEDARAAVAAARAAGLAGFDFETNGGRLWSPDLRVTCAALNPVGRDEAYVWSGAALDASSPVWQVLTEYLADATAKKCGTNLKFDSNVLRTVYGVELRGIEFDTQLMGRLLNPEADADLDTCGWLVACGGHKEEAQQALKGAATAVRKSRKILAAGEAQVAWLIPEAKPVLPENTTDRAAAYGFLPPALRDRYCARDTIASGRVTTRFAGDVKDAPDLDFIWNDVIRFAPGVFSRIESRGFPIDMAALHATAEKFHTEIQAAIGEFHKLAPGINPDSSEQLADLLYTRLGLPVPHLTDGGNPSTDSAAMKELEGSHPVIEHIQRYGELTHLRGIYLDGTPEPGQRVGKGGMFKHARLGADGLYRIHSTYNLTGARCLPAGELMLTGRGYIPVETVKVGDFVISHTGTPRRVEAVSVNAPSPIVRVRLSNGLVLRTTADHAYWTGAEWVPAGDLTPGGAVAVHSGTEDWRVIPEWSEFEVSSWGRVRNVVTKHIRKQSPKGRWGHLKVTLTRNGAQRRGADKKDCAVHRLVLSAFGGAAPSDKPEVRHLNGIAWDNTVRNLAWGSCLENRADAHRHGTMSWRHGAHPCTKLTEEDVAAIRAAKRRPPGNINRWHPPEGVPDATLAQKYGVSRETIRDIRSGKRWRAETHVEGRAVPFETAHVVEVVHEPPAVTYGATVEVDHSHVTGGVVTHNTGRLSSSDPNLQNVPRSETEEGKLIKDMFYAAPGRVMLQLDYSQLELRIAAMLSGDPDMLAIFESGVDYHMRTAELIAGAKWGSMNKDERKALRSKAKVVNFALLYGKGVKNMAKEMGVTIAEAQAVKDAILGKFKRLRAWLDTQILEVNRTGMLYTVWKGRRARRRSVHHLEYKDTVAANTPIQGSGSDFCLASVIGIEDWAEADRVDAGLTGTVHDSIILFPKIEDLAEVTNNARAIMEGWESGGVPIRVDAEYGRRWGSLKPLDLDNLDYSLLAA